MRWQWIVLWAVTGLTQAQEMQVAKGMAFPQPELAVPGVCVMYREGGAGFILTEPQFWLKGTVLKAEIRNQRVGRCQQTDKPIERYTREEFVRLATNQPCVSRDELARDEMRGIIRLRVDRWETPHAAKMLNAGRLYRGSYLDQKLEAGVELEIDAKLLGACS